MDTIEGIPEIEHTWRKIESISKQTGLREGLSDGRDSNFQESFDIGYSEGFKNGYLLGKCKGSLQYQQLQHENCNSKEVNYPPLEKITRGDCIICKEPNLLEEDIKEIKIKQDNTYRKNEQVMKKLEVISSERT